MMNAMNEKTMMAAAGNQSFSPKERAENFLKLYARNYTIFMDSSSWMDAHAQLFLSCMKPWLRQYGRKMISAMVDQKQMDVLANDHPFLEQAARARAASLLMDQVRKEGLLTLGWDKQDKDGKSLLLSKMRSKRMEEPVLLVTQDQELAKAAMAMNEDQSVHCHEVQVLRINQFGYLSPFSFHQPVLSSEEIRRMSRLLFGMTGSDPVFSGTGSVSHAIPAIPARWTPISEVDDKHLPIRHAPVEGDEVFTAGCERYILGRKLGSGGEGAVYELEGDYAAKIYASGKLTEMKRKKLEMLAGMHLDEEGLCLPQKILYNKDREFCGFIMPRAKGKALIHSVFLPYIRHPGNPFSSWKRKDTVELCLTILRKVQYLHDHGILIGDLNPYNIQVVSPREVYLVDMDSVQVGGYPCPVGVTEFTAPEIQHQKYSQFLRSMGNENFALATLLFKIMLPGKSPYAQRGGDDAASNIARGDFSYPCGEKSNKKAPAGPWRFCWSHLPRFLKNDFYETFHKNGAHWDEVHRYGTEQWLHSFQRFYELLVSGKYGEQDPMSLELFPTRFKRTKECQYVTCQICGQEVPADYCEAGICQNCLRDGEHYHCASCGKEMVYSNYEKYVKHSKRFVICPECFQKSQEVLEYRVCRSCGQMFPIREGEKEYYESHRMPLPQRCPDCRKVSRSRMGA